MISLLLTKPYICSREPTKSQQKVVFKRRGWCFVGLSTYYCCVFCLSGFLVGLYQDSSVPRAKKRPSMNEDDIALLVYLLYLLLYFMTITVNFIRLFGRSLPGQFCAGGKQGRGSCTGRSFKIIYSVLFKNTVSRDFLALTIWITQFCMVFLFS